MGLPSPQCPYACAGPGRCFLIISDKDKEMDELQLVVKLIGPLPQHVPPVGEDG